MLKACSYFVGNVKTVVIANEDFLEISQLQNEIDFDYKWMKSKVRVVKQIFTTHTIFLKII